MPLKVPGSNVVPMEGSGPSQVDLWMALATMKQLNRIPTFDERFAGQGPGLPIDAQAKGGPVYGIQKGAKGMNPDISFEPEQMKNPALDFTDRTPDKPGPPQIHRVRK